MNLSKIRLTTSLLVLFVLLGGFFVSINRLDAVTGVQVRDGDGENDGCTNKGVDTESASDFDCGGGGGGARIPSVPYNPPNNPEPPIVTRSESSNSVTVIVEPVEPSISGTLTSRNNSCLISLGSSFCNVAFDWSTNPVNPPNTSAVTRNPSSGFIIQNNNKGVNISLPVAYPSSSFFLYNNGAKLDEVKVTSACQENTKWDSGSDSCVSESAILNSFTATDCMIETGSNACNTNLNWNVGNTSPSFKITTPTNITVSTSPTGSNVSYAVSYPSRNFYIYNSGDLLGQVTASAQCRSGYWDNVINKCIEPVTSCSEPLSKTIEVPCGTQNGVASISGYVLRKQDKSAYPVCAFPSTVNTNNSTYVSDTCTYPESICINGATNYPTCDNNFCPIPLSKIVEVPCDTQDGLAAISGSVFRKQNKSAYPVCAFPSTVTVDNSTYDSDTCKYPMDDGGEGEGSGDNPYWLEEVCGSCNSEGERACQKTCSMDPSTGKLCDGNIYGVKSYLTSEGCGVSGGENGIPSFNIGLYANPASVFKGRATRIIWSSGADSCFATQGDGFNTDGKADGEKIVSPTKSNTTYEIECIKTGYGSKKASINVKVVNINITES